MTDNSERSVSRGRETLQSTGRGGYGNIRPSSASRDRVTDGPDDFSATRGREPGIRAGQVYSTGRGGAGNISHEVHPSPTRRDPAEEALLHAHAEAEKTAVHSSGRGGLGNISRSRSRSRQPTSPLSSPPVHSTGRGGAGNIRPGDPHGEDILEEDLERKLISHHEGLHSTGRGGAANMTSTPEPAVEHPAHHAGEFESTGRGGAGNIHGHTPQPGSSRAPSKERHGLSGFIHKVTHPHSHSPKDRSPAPKETSHEAAAGAATPPPVIGEEGVDPANHRGGIL